MNYLLLCVYLLIGSGALSILGYTLLLKLFGR